MSDYSRLSAEEINALDTLIGKLSVDAAFITAIAQVVARVVPVVVRATPQVARIATAVTPAVAGGGQVNLAEYIQGAEARVLSGKLTAQDLIEIRNKLAGGS
jgi:hypothetical protein